MLKLFKYRASYFDAKNCYILVPNGPELLKLYHMVTMLILDIIHIANKVQGLQIANERLLFAKSCNYFSKLSLFTVNRCFLTSYAFKMFTLQEVV